MSGVQVGVVPSSLPHAAALTQRSAPRSAKTNVPKPLEKGLEEAKACLVVVFMALWGSGRKAPAAIRSPKHRPECRGRASSLLVRGASGNVLSPGERVKRERRVAIRPCRAKLERRDDRRRVTARMFEHDPGRGSRDA